MAVSIWIVLAIDGVRVRSEVDDFPAHRALVKPIVSRFDDIQIVLRKEPSVIYHTRFRPGPVRYCIRVKVKSMGKVARRFLPSPSSVRPISNRVSNPAPFNSRPAPHTCCISPMAITNRRVWLITGANSGLGLALAEYVLSQGDLVSPLTLL